MKKTLAEIIESEKKIRHENGTFGIKACKESIQFKADYFHKDLYTILKELVERANNENGFNTAMVLACWEMINEQ